MIQKWIAQKKCLKVKTQKQSHWWRYCEHAKEKKTSKESRWKQLAIISRKDPHAMRRTWEEKKTSKCWRKEVETKRLHLKCSCDVRCKSRVYSSISFFWLIGRMKRESPPQYSRSSSDPKLFVTENSLSGNISIGLEVVDDRGQVSSVPTGTDEVLAFALVLEMTSFFGSDLLRVEKRVPAVNEFEGSVLELSGVRLKRNLRLSTHCFWNSFLEAIWKRKIARPWRVLRMAKMYWKARVALSIIGIPSSHVMPRRTVRPRAAFAVVPDFFSASEYWREVLIVVRNLWTHLSRRTVFASRIAHIGVKKA